MRAIIGNLLDCPEGINVIIHQANIERRMGAGFAKALASKYPAVAKADRYGDSVYTYNVLGTFTKAIVKDDLIVYNAYGQSINNFSLMGFPTSYDAIYKSLCGIRDDIKEWADEGDEVLIGVPYFMGCALGGGDWDIYEKILEKTLFPFDIVAVKLP